MLDPELKVQVMVLLVWVLVRLPFARVINASSWSLVRVIPGLLPVPLATTELICVATVLVVSTSARTRFPETVRPDAFVSVIDPVALAPPEPMLKLSMAQDSSDHT